MHYSIGSRQTNDQWNRVESPETDPCIYGQLIFYKSAKGIHWIISTNGAGTIK